jgi:hypothetical protein
MSSDETQFAFNNSTEFLFTYEQTSPAKKPITKVARVKSTQTQKDTEKAN